MPSHRARHRRQHRLAPLTPPAAPPTPRCRCCFATLHSTRSFPPRLTPLPPNRHRRVPTPLRYVAHGSRPSTQPRRLRILSRRSSATATTRFQNQPIPPAANNNPLRSLRRLLDSSAGGNSTSGTAPLLPRVAFALRSVRLPRIPSHTAPVAPPAILGSQHDPRKTIKTPLAPATSLTRHHKRVPDHAHNVALCRILLRIPSRMST